MEQQFTAQDFLSTSKVFFAVKRYKVCNRDRRFDVGAISKLNWSAQHALRMAAKEAKAGGKQTFKHLHMIEWSHVHKKVVVQSCEANVC